MHPQPTVAKSLSLPLRSPRVEWVLLLIPLAGAVGCFGGQTGTELAPAPAEDTRNPETGGSETSGETDGGSKGDGLDVRNPATASIVCDGSESALSQFIAATGVSAAAVTEFLSQVNPFTLTTSDGSNQSATLGLSNQPGSCVASDGQGTTLLVPMNLLISSADGGVRVTLSAMATAIPKPDGGVARLELEGSAECDPISCAITWVDTTGYASLRPTVSARIQAFGTGVQLLGEMTVWGRPKAECATVDCSSSPWRSVVEVFLSRLD